MIREIIKLLPSVEEDTERIRIAKGKYKLPETFKEGFKQFKKEFKLRING
ncbi:hypothetical protein [Phenylobacterium sp.]|jgi:hypothetical protein|nr:hypothetical protein [Phenylobacterium sp.]